MGDGSSSAFESTGLNSSDYQDLTGNHDQLTRINDGINYGYNLTKKNQITFEYRRLSVNPPPEVAAECTSNPDSSFCSKIVLLRIKDWADNELTFEYDASVAALKAVRDEMGRRLELDYFTTPALLLKSVTERISGTARRSVSFEYTPDGLLSKYVDPIGNSTRYAYYEEAGTLRNKLLKSITYPKGNTILIDYDQLTGMAKSKIDGATGGETKVTYPTANTVTITDPENNAFNLILSGVLPTHFKGHNDANWATVDRTDTRSPSLPTRVQDQNGNVTQYEYDERGNLTKTINARGKIALSSYNTKNNVTDATRFHDPSVTNPPKTTFIYDYQGNRLKSTTDPDNKTTHIDYDSYNQVSAITDARLYTSAFEYDTYGNLSRVTDPEGNSTTYVNDYAGKTTSVTDAEGVKTGFVFDLGDRLKDIVNYARSGQALRAVHQIYDKNGNVESINWLNQGVSSETRYAYDDRDRLRSVVKPNGADKVLSYYETDLLMTREYANNFSTTYYYDDHNRLQESRYPDGTKVQIIRDYNGNMRSITSRSGLVSSFTYNQLNQILSYTDPYNKTVAYGYNDAGQVNSIVYPGNKTVNYTFDSVGRLKTVQDWTGGLVTYHYDAIGNIERVQRSNGISTYYTYDRASRLTGIAEKNASGTTLWSYTYTLDRVGNHLSVNAVNEPQAYSAAAENISYTNDKASNQLLTAGSTSYSYDNNGNRITSSVGGVTTQYSWDYENMLTKISAPGQSDIESAYDAMNNRVAGRSVPMLPGTY